MKKLIITLSVFTLILTSLSMSTSTSASSDKYVYSDDPFEIKNTEAKEKLNEFLNQKNKLRNSEKSDNLELDTQI